VVSASHNAPRCARSGGGAPPTLKNGGKNTRRDDYPFSDTLSDGERGEQRGYAREQRSYAGYDDTTHYGLTNTLIDQGQASHRGMTNTTNSHYHNLHNVPNSHTQSTHHGMVCVAVLVLAMSVLVCTFFNTPRTLTLPTPACAHRTEWW